MKSFNSQICTTREQSERLLALGLKKETADMAYLWYGRSEDDTPLLMDKPSIVYQGIMTTHDLPAWSLHRLIEMKQPNKIDNAIVVLSREQTYDKLIGMIAKSIKEGHFKEYLEEKL